MASPSCFNQRSTLALVVGIPPAFGTFSVVRMTSLLDDGALCQYTSRSMHFAIHRGPIGLAHRLAVELSGRSLWELPPKLHRLGRFHAAQLHLAMGEYSILVEQFTVLEDDNGFHRLTPLLIGHSNNGALPDLRQRHDSPFDFPAIYVEPAADDHVLLAIDDIDVPVLVHIANVTGVVPAVRPDLCSGLGQVVIPARHQRSARHDLSALARRKNLAVVVHDRNPHRGRRPPTTAQAFRMVAARSRRHRGRVQPGEKHRRFRLAIRLAHTRPKGLDTSLQLVRGYR